MKKVLLLFVLILLSSCVKYNIIEKYPIKTITIDNYKEPDFQYTEIKNFEYEFCGKAILLYVNIPDWYNIKIEAVNKLNNEYQLKKDEIILISEKQGKFFIFPLFYTKNCRIVELKIVKKI